MPKAALVTLFAFALSLIFVRALVTILNRLGMRQIIRKEMPDSHQKKAKTPMMGGIGIFLAALAATGLAGGLGYPKVKMVFIAAGLCFLIGLADDLSKFTGRNTKGIGARYKLVVEVLIGGLLAYFMIWQGKAPGIVAVPFGRGVADLGAWFIPFVIFVFVGTINSVNFTDGVDGLVSGCFVAVAAGFIYLVSRTGDHTLVPALCAVCGAVAAFLWFNSHPASIFMGDCGSLFLGGFLAAVSVVTRLEFFLAVAGLVFVAEMLSVMIQVVSFRLTGRRVFRMAPVHHHFELSGWSETQVSQRFWLVSAALAVAGAAMFAA